MSINIKMPRTGAGAVRVAYGPLAELAVSLHVLVNPDHHPLQHPFIRRMRALPPRLRAEIAALEHHVESDLPDPLVGPLADPAAPFEEQLAGMQAAPEDLVRRRYDDPDPLGAHRRMCRVVEDYWELAFADEWAAIEPTLATASEALSRSLDRLGVFGTLDEFGPRVAARPDEGIVEVRCLPGEVSCQENHELDFDSDAPIVLSPSVFASPHTWVDVGTPVGSRMMLPSYAVPAPHEWRAPADLLELLDACSDDARLRVLRVLADQPRSVQELAPMLAMAPSTVSKHLRALSNAGVVEGDRDGWWVVYRLRADRIRPLAQMLGAFLRIDDLSSR